MTVEQKIRKLVADTSADGQSYANACRIWKGYGEMGERPYGWWLKPFGENARSIGSSWKEVEELW